MAGLPEPSEEMAHLPRVIRALVQRRRSVKDLIKRESDPVRAPGVGCAWNGRPPVEESQCASIGMGLCVHRYGTVRP